jgi:hypothetical protein
MIDLNNNSISLAGEFAVLSQLTLRGYDASLTLGNTKSVDILVADPKTGRMFKIEVKTHYRNTSTHSDMFGHTLGWVMSEKHEEIKDPDLYYIFVSIVGDNHSFRFFIVPSAIVANYVKEQHAYWLKSRPNEENKYTNIRKFRIGLDESTYTVPTALSKDYENCWEFNNSVK